MTTIVICGDGDVRLPDVVGDARVVVAHDLCARLGDLGRWIDGDRQVVLGVHRRHVDLGSLQAAVRRVGLDPLRVGLLELDTVANTDDLVPALAATVARSAIGRPADPSQIKLLPPDRSTRRSLLSIGKSRYVAAPAVDVDACHASDGCRVCIDSCPSAALSWGGGTVAHDVTSCVVCGLCTSACPTAAIGIPGLEAEAVEAEIRAAVETAGPPMSIRYRCRDSRVPAEPGWYQLEVPCTGMLTPGWILAPLAVGAGAVDVVMCSEGGCALGNDQHTAGILADTVSIADHLGVRFDEPLDPERLISRDEPLLAPASTARIAAGLSGTRSVGPPLALAVADVGQVTIDSSVCTACERCAQVCPSQAMSSSRTDDTVVLSFDPQRCTGCSSCLAVCPEADRGAIQVRRELDLTELALGERVIDEVPTATCELCGKPVAPAKMLARIGSILGDDADATMAVIGRRCQQCRGR